MVFMETSRTLSSNIDVTSSFSKQFVYRPYLCHVFIKYTKISDFFPILLRKYYKSLIKRLLWKRQKPLGVGHMHVAKLKKTLTLGLKLCLFSSNNRRFPKIYRIHYGNSWKRSKQAYHTNEHVHSMVDMGKMFNNQKKCH